MMHPRRLLLLSIVVLTVVSTSAYTATGIATWGVLGEEGETCITACTAAGATCDSTEFDTSPFNSGAKITQLMEGLLGQNYCASTQGSGPAVTPDMFGHGYSCMWIDKFKTSGGDPWGGQPCTITTVYNRRLLCPCTPAAASVQNDPHFVGGHGGTADFRGKHNTLFNLLSHKNISVATLFREAKYTDDMHRSVYGTYMTKAYVNVLTTLNTTLHITYEAGEVEPKHATIAWVKDGKEVRATELVSGDEATEGNVKVKVEPTTQGLKMTVTQLGRWTIESSTAQYFDESNGINRNMHRVDIKVRTLSPTVEAEAVSPHGIIGQSFDGDNLAVSGMKDDYNKSGVITSAQGEGALEGSWTDYIVSSPFSTDFKYSRFSVKAAPPRDVTKLTGFKELRPQQAVNQALAWA